MKNKVLYYSFNNNNIIHTATLYLKESQEIARIVRQFFFDMNLSDPKVNIQMHKIYVRFYYYNPGRPIDPKRITQLEQELSKQYKRKVKIDGIPLIYPFTDSQIFANHFHHTPLKEIRKKVQTYLRPVEDSLFFIPGKYLSGIQIQVGGRYYRNQKRSKREKLFLGTKSPYFSTRHSTTRTVYGLRTMTVTLYFGL